MREPLREPRLCLHAHRRRVLLACNVGLMLCAAALAASYNSGQDCTAATRAIVANDRTSPIK